MPVLHLDLETRSIVDLRKTGVYVYAEHPTTDVWCAAYAIDDQPIKLWKAGESTPDDIVRAVDSGWEIWAHNASFERVLWRYVLGPRYGWPEPQLEQFRCTMVCALAMGLPGALAKVAPALQLEVTKDAQGADVMKRLSRPRRFESDGSPVWWDDAEKSERLHSYCIQDVEVERQVHKRIVVLTQDEQKLYFLDQRINDRGVYIDAALCNAAKKIVDTARKRLDDRMEETTNGLVHSCSNVGLLCSFLEQNGVEVESMRKDQVAAMLSRRDLPDAVRDALELRQDAAKASVKKIDAALAGRSSDGRAKGLFFMNGATTGRWAGRRVQPQNLPRPAYGADLEQIVEDVMTADYDLVDILHGAPMMAVSNILRGIISAAPGNELVCADFSNIEGRVLAWLAGEQWKLDAFAAYDAGTGPDLYKVAYGRSFGIDPAAVDGDQRQIGKVQELALGYQGGVGAFQSMARLYGVDIGESYDMLRDAAPEATEQAQKAYEERGKNGDIAKESWIAAEIVKLGWREAHPNITAFWRDLEEAAIQALHNPGEKTICGKLCFLKAGSFLWLRLPSGRPLCYPYPSLVEKTMPWKDRNGNAVTKLTFSYKTEVNRQFVDSGAYGGLWAENVTQATARDLLAEALKRLEASGYPVISHAHDEAVAEVPLGFGSVESFCEIMSASPTWAAGCPVSAAGWHGLRYRKA